MKIKAVLSTRAGNYPKLVQQIFDVLLKLNIHVDATEQHAETMVGMEIEQELMFIAWYPDYPDADSFVSPNRRKSAALFTTIPLHTAQSQTLA